MDHVWPGNDPECPSLLQHEPSRGDLSTTTTQIVSHLFIILTDMYRCRPTAYGPSATTTQIDVQHPGKHKAFV